MTLTEDGTRVENDRKFFPSSICLTFKSLSIIVLYFIVITEILNNKICNKMYCHYGKLSEVLDDTCYLVVEEVISNKS
jgi:hypothetical protein